MRIRINGELFIILSMYLLLIYLCLPISMTYLNSVLIRMLVFVSAFFFVAGMVMLNKWKYLFVFSGMFIFTFLFWVITWSVQLDTITYVYYCFSSLTFVFGGIVLYYSDNEAMLKRMFIFLTVIYFITAITTILGLNIYPLAARELARGSTYDTSLDFTTRKNIYRSMNIASWSQIYGMLFAIPTSLFVWKKRRHIIYLILCIALGIMMIASQITFAVLLALLLIVGVIISCENNTKTILISFLVAIVAILLLFNLEGVMSFSVTVSDNAGLDFLSTKLNDIKTLLLYRSVVGNAGARGDLYTRSFGTFLNSPIVGLLLGGKGNLNNIGYHSDFFDMLGTFGLVGLVVIVSSLVSFHKFLKRTASENRREMIIIFFGFTILFVLNPIFNSPQIFVGAFLYPILGSRYCLMTETEKKKEARIVRHKIS